MTARRPAAGQLRSWVFDDDGGFGDGAWTREGKRWEIKAAGVQGDGSELTATNIITPVDRDTFLWQSVDRTLDGVEGAVELDQHAVAHAANRPAAMPDDCRFDQIFYVARQSTMSALFIGAHQATVADDVGQQDRG